MNEAHFESLYLPNSRFDEIEEVFKHIKSGDSCQVIGLPGVGRANMLELLIYNHAVREQHLGDNQKWFHFVGVDFSEVRNKPLFEVTKLIFLELVESLHERRMDEEYETTTAIFKEALSYQDELVLFQGLKKSIDYLATEKELTIVFLFERFEEYIPMLTSEFFSNLRVLRSKAKYHFSVIFSLGRPLEDIIDPFMLSDFYEFFAGNTVFLSLYDKPISDFRINYLEKIAGKKLNPSFISKTLKLTGGHGKLTRHCLEIVIQKENMPDTDDFLHHKHVEGALLEIWHYLTPEEQQDLLNSIKNTTPILNPYLEKIFLVEKGKITISLFAVYIKELLSKLPEQKIVFDETTNSIKKGNDLLSDMLTASEFRLLRLLLAHEGSVVERNQIIEAVWGDLASTQGVTEQALDQLIFRLRKKIEEDPTKPEHILTIKGRGIKYQS